MIRTKNSLLYFLKFLCFFLSSNPTHLDSFGQSGYINVPSAETFSESSVAFGLNNNNPDSKIFYTASPFDWLDATIFYVDIKNKTYPGSDFRQSYKDKGFNFKVNLLHSKRTNSYLSLGINDVGGTGYYSSEYLVYTKKFYDSEITLGLGWGFLGSGLTLSNPLKFLDDKFLRDRKRAAGGSIRYQNFFSGNNASYLFAYKYRFGDNLNLIFEVDPLKIDNRYIRFPEKKSKYNYGIQYDREIINFGVSSIRGNDLSFNLGFKYNFEKFTNNPPYRYRKVESINDLIIALEENGIGISEVSTSEDSIHVVTKQNTFTNQYEANERIYKSTKNLLDENEDVIISQKYLDMEVVKVFYPDNFNGNFKKEEYISTPSKETLFKSKEKFPVIFNTISPRIRTMLAAREGFIYQGLMLEDDFEIFFTNNLYLKGNLKVALSDNFDGLFIPPVDTYPNQVRSDIKKYLNNFDKVPIGRLELNYFKSLQQKHFFRFSAGLFEEMFGGYGVEYLNYPQGSLIAFGVEAFKVYKRDYEMKFDFLEYDNFIFRSRLKLIEPNTKINIDISYGEYLAGDTGVTYKFSRKLDNGIIFSAFFSDTNVTAEQYGEGSFDKGVYVKVPISIIGALFNGNAESLSSFEWRPLTKDPASLLIKSIDIFDEIQRYRVY